MLLTGTIARSERDVTPVQITCYYLRQMQCGCLFGIIKQILHVSEGDSIQILHGSEGDGTDYQPEKIISTETLVEVDIIFRGLIIRTITLADM